jgi:Cd2+/Zn2+-exporting ATPase
MPQTETLELNITGMDCANCALNLERGVARLDGVEACTVTFTTGKMRLSGELDPAAIEPTVSGHWATTSPRPDEADAPADTLRITPELRGLFHYLRSRQDTTLAMIGGRLLLLAVLGSLLGAPGALVTGTHLLVVALAGTLC